jgi:acyl carrier protein
METQDAIKEYIIKEFMYDQPDAVLDNDEPLLQGGILDSLGIFTLIAFIEERFGVKVQPEDVVVENFETVNTICSLIEATRAAQAAVGQ